MFRWSGVVYRCLDGVEWSTDVEMEWRVLQMFRWSGGFYRCLDGVEWSTDV